MVQVELGAEDAVVGDEEHWVLMQGRGRGVAG